MKHSKALKMFSVHLLLFALGTALFLGCAKSAFQKGQEAYFKADFDKSIEYFEQMKTKKDKNYVLYMLDLGTAYFTAGDYYEAENAFLAGIQTMEKDVSEAQAAVQLAKSDAKKTYTGDPHDMAMAHVFTGLLNMELGDLEAAEIEFRKALESDRGKEEKYEGDLCLAHYFLGQVYRMKGELDNARIAFRNVTEHRPEFPYAWYELADIAEQENLSGEAETFLQNYRDKDNYCSLGRGLEHDPNLADLTIVLCLGKGPMKKADPFLGAFSQVAERKYKEEYAELSVGGALLCRSYQVDDVTHQAKTSGGFGGELARKTAQVVAQQALQAVPGVGLFSGLLLGGAEADVRYWYTLPGEFHIIRGLVAPGNYSLELKFYDKKDKELEGYRQVWYYVPVREGQSNILILRSMLGMQKG